uniref:Uncharacterized protein n=1 Tax=Myotis myotis TaxID=51298 RepID=A0A7J8AM18_MYOMY|nr:hypothetical protein mMyoMyo1_007980 [Myotis myotis]
MHRAGRLGGCDATLSHDQGRADWGVGAPSPVTLKAGSMGRLQRHALSCTEQGQSGGWGTASCHSQSKANQGVGALPPVTLRVGAIGEMGHRPLSHTDQGPSGGWGAATLTLRAGPMGRLWLYPSHTEQGPWGGGVGELPPIRHRAGLLRGLGRLPLSQTEQDG